jgi:hypothetical protein
MNIDRIYDEAPLWLSPKRLTFGVALILAPLTAWTTGLIGHGHAPTVIKPLPFPWVWLAWAFGWAIPVLPSAMFWLWCGSLFYGKPTGRNRTRATAFLVGLLSILWFYAGWAYGLKYQSLLFDVVSAICSLLFAAAIAAILASSRRTVSFTWSLTANFLIFAWLLTYAFPYLGELP